MSTHLDLLREFLSAHLPPQLAFAVGSLHGTIGELLPPENAVVANAVEGRRREFALGRSVARKALEQLSHPPVPIPAAADRSPVWPKGIVGSITHSKCIAAAVVGRQASGCSMVGIDVQFMETNSDLLETIATKRERDAYATAGIDDNLLFHLLFSVKESAYKAWYPRLKRYLSADDIEIEFDFRNSAFTAGVTPLLPLRVDRLSGRFAVLRDMSVAFAVG